MHNTFLIKIYQGWVGIARKLRDVAIYAMRDLHIWL